MTMTYEQIQAFIYREAGCWTTGSGTNGSGATTRM